MHPEVRPAGLLSKRRRTARSGRLAVVLLAALLVLMPAWAGTRVGRWANSAVQLQALDQLPGLLDWHEPDHRVVGAVPAPDSPQGN